jgi:UDP-3-O-[3-hydroxymyristoyl] glucosamine N-acyltransferase
VAGSTTLGAGVVVGGAVGIRDHLHMGDRSRIGMFSAVYQDVSPGAVVSGIPAHDHDDALRAQAAVRRLPELVKKGRELQREVKLLQSPQRADGTNNS